MSANTNRMQPAARRRYCILLQDGGQPVAPRSGAAAGGLKGGSSGAAAQLRFDAEWIAEHAAQVSRMLPGGEYSFRV